MKVAPSYFSREKLLKKVAKRNAERIAEHTTVSSAFKHEDEKLIQESRDSAARYAQRHHLNLEFMPNLTNYKKDGTKVRVYQRVVRQTTPYDGSDPIIYGDQEFLGSTVIPQAVNNVKDFMKSLRDQVKDIITKK